MPAFIRYLAPLPALLLLAACNPKPAAAPELPVLSRPVVSAQARNGRVLVPQTTVTELGGAPGVFVLQDGKARFRMVRTGKTSNSLIEALAGLNGTEMLVSGNLGDVHDGSPIEAH